MDLSTLKPAKGAVKKKKRIARGEGSGKGGTSTKGHKGAKSRSGYKSRVGFEGGQNPIQRRLPKRGFKNINRLEYSVINLNTLQEIVENKKVEKAGVEDLRKFLNVSKDAKIKVLARGEIKSKIEITAHAASNKAKEAIEKAGGKIEIIAN